MIVSDIAFCFLAAYPISLMDKLESTNMGRIILGVDSHLEWTNGNDVVKGLLPVFYAKFPKSFVEEFKYEHNGEKTAKPSVPELASERFSTTLDKSIIIWKGKSYVNEISTHYSGEKVINAATLYYILYLNLHADYPIGTISAKNIWFYGARILAYINGWVDAIGMSEITFLDTAYANAAEESYKNMLTAILPHLKVISELTLTSAVNYFNTGHNNGGAGLSKFSRSIFDNNEFFTSMKLDDERIASEFYRNTHFFSKRNLLHSINPELFTASVIPGFRRPIIITSAKQLVDRINGAPAGTHKYAVLHGIMCALESFKLAGLVFRAPIVLKLNEIIKGIKLSPATYHTGAYWLCHGSGEKAQVLNNEIDNIDQLIADSATVLKSVSAKHSLLNSPHVSKNHSGVNPVIASLTRIFMEKLDAALEKNGKDLVDSYLKANPMIQEGSYEFVAEDPEEDA